MFTAYHAIMFAVLLIGGAGVIFQASSGDDSLDSTGFEVSYTYSLNDNVTLTPGFFTVEDTSTGDDDTGVVLETIFSF